MANGFHPRSMDPCRTGFDFEQLDAYRVAMEFLEAAVCIADGLPRGRAFVADQLVRAAGSIAHNIAQGSGEYKPREKARFYRIALRSATEAASAVEVARRLSPMVAREGEKGRALLLRIVALLTALVKAQDRRTAAE